MNKKALFLIWLLISWFSVRSLTSGNRPWWGTGDGVEVPANLGRVPGAPVGKMVRTAAFWRTRKVCYWKTRFPQN